MSKLQALNCYVFMPLIHVPALFLCDPLYENMTHIAYAKQYFFYVLLWSIACALTLFISTNQFMRFLGYKKKTAQAVLAVVCSFMIISVCIPYDVEHLPFFSKLHVRLAMIATIGYILLFLYLLMRNYYLHYPLIAPLFHRYIVWISCLSFLFLIMGSVSVILEASFVIGMTYLLYDGNRKAAQISAACD